MRTGLSTMIVRAPVAHQALQHLREAGTGTAKLAVQARNYKIVMFLFGLMVLAWCTMAFLASIGINPTPPKVHPEAQTTIQKSERPHNLT